MSFLYVHGPLPVRQSFQSDISGEAIVLFELDGVPESVAKASQIGRAHV